MKYPDDYINKIICGDCLEVMKQMPDKSIDLVLTDPPYGINAHLKRGDTGRNKHIKQRDYFRGEWDSEIPSKEVFDELVRVSKNQIIWGGNYFVEYLKNSSCWIVWDKDNGDNYYADAELAWTSFDTAVRKFRWKWHGFLQEVMGDDKENRQHLRKSPYP